MLREAEEGVNSGRALRQGAGGNSVGAA
jgi:hypothetical protein